MKIALIGQNIPMKLPSMLADLLFSEKTPADLFIEGKEETMEEVLGRYCRAVIRKSGLNAHVTVTSDRQRLLEYADCVIYDGDVMPGSCFHQDWEALASPEDDDPGLCDQCRVNGGIEGILHSMRQGKVIHKLADDMRRWCQNAFVITMAKPLARCVEMFEMEGFVCYGLGSSPLEGENGLTGICRRLNLKTSEVDFACAGLPSFEFITRLDYRKNGMSLIPDLQQLIENDEMGRLTRRWMEWYSMAAVGDVLAHAEFLPAQPDFMPAERPVFGETVEKRKERILYMNKVGELGCDSQEGAMAQLLLLSKAGAERPIQLALSIIHRKDMRIQAVTRKNNGTLPQLDDEAIIEAELVLDNGKILTEENILTDEAADVCWEIDEANRLAARAALGDRTALRQLIDMDPAMSGLDRMYCHDVVDKLIAMNGDLVIEQ